jgi:hypothetical protein
VAGLTVSDEWVIVVAVLGGLAVMAVALLRYQRGKEARLRALTEIEIPIHSLSRSVLVIVPAIAVGPVLVGLVAASADPWARHHALAMTLMMLGSGVPGIFAGWRLSRRWSRIGLLRCTPARLEIQLRGKGGQTDLERPYELTEGSTLGPGNLPVQVVYVRQGDNLLGFSYGLPLGRKPHGEGVFDRWVEPLVDAEARVIHDRLRRQP